MHITIYVIFHFSKKWNWFSESAFKNELEKYICNYFQGPNGKDPSFL